jgi:hypothetical protein
MHGSAKVMWLPTRMTGPVLGTFSLPLMCQRVKSQKNDLTAHLLMKKNNRDTAPLLLERYTNDYTQRQKRIATQENKLAASLVVNQSMFIL